MSRETKQETTSKLPQDFFDQAEEPKSEDKWLNKEEEDEYQKFEEELTQDLNSLKRSYAQEEDDFDQRETKLQEHEEYEMKERIQHLKELLKQRKLAKTGANSKESVLSDSATDEREIRTENSFSDTVDDADVVLNWKRKKRVER